VAITLADAPAIIIDTREQTPWTFGHASQFNTLKTGDYSILGLEEVVVLERKRHNEFIQCMTHERDRFVRELDRAQAIPLFHVIVEASLKGVLDCLYDDWPNGTHPNAIRGTLAAWSNRYPTVRFWFPGDRETSATWAEHLLRKTWLDITQGKLRIDTQKRPKQEAA
jgi:ERCC4-type nuclease